MREMGDQVFQGNKWELLFLVPVVPVVALPVSIVIAHKTIPACINVTEGIFDAFRCPVGLRDTPSFDFHDGPIGIDHLMMKNKPGFHLLYSMPHVIKSVKGRRFLSKAESAAGAGPSGAMGSIPTPAAILLGALFVYGLCGPGPGCPFGPPARHEDGYTC